MFTVYDCRKKKFIPGSKNPDFLNCFGIRDYYMFYPYKFKQMRQLTEGAGLTVAKIRDTPPDSVTKINEVLVKSVPTITYCKVSSTTVL